MGRGRREEERPQFLARLMRCVGHADKRESGRPPMLICMGGDPCNRGGQNVLEKKGLHPKMEPYESGANGRGRRKRRLPLDKAEGGGSAQIRVDFSRGRGRRVRRGVSSTRRYMLHRDRSRNASICMPAMRWARGGSDGLTQWPTGAHGSLTATDPNNKAPLEGRAGPKFCTGQSRCKEGTPAGEEGEVPAGVGASYRAAAVRASIPACACQPCGPRISLVF